LEFIINSISYNQRTRARGRIGQKLQNLGDLETSYVIVVLKIPKNIWQK